MVAKLERPAPSGQGTYAELDGDATFNSINVGSSSEPGVLGIVNSSSLPDFGLDGFLHWNNNVYFRTTDIYGATYLKLMDDGSVTGSYLGEGYVAGLDLSVDAVAVEQNYLYSSDGGYTAGSYDPTTDNLDLDAGSGALPAPTILLSNDSVRGLTVDYSVAGSGSSYAFSQYAFSRLTGLTLSSKKMVLGAWIRPCATGFYNVGGIVSKSIVGVELSESPTQKIGIGAVYDSTTIGAPLESIAAYSIGTINAQVIAPLITEPVVGQWYYVSIEFDGSTGLQYRVDGVLLGDETDLAPPVDPDISDWVDTRYGYSFISGSALTSTSGSLDNVGLDYFQFWKAL